MHPLINSNIQKMFEVGGLSKQIQDRQYDVISDLVNMSCFSNMKVIEVGSWVGLSSILLGLGIQRMLGKLYCVDHFKGNLGGGEHLIKVASIYDIKSIFRDNIKTFGLENTIELIVSSSEEASYQFKDGDFDLVFIDGDHSPEGIAKDIELYYPKVKWGGVISGHDYETCKAVIDEKFPKAIVREDVWYFRKEK